MQPNCNPTGSQAAPTALIKEWMVQRNPLGGIEGHEPIAVRLEPTTGQAFAPRLWDLRCSCGGWQEIGRGDNAWTAQRFRAHLDEVERLSSEPSER
jgi:hypothetical protein